jgi:hypothetical protein
LRRSSGAAARSEAVRLAEENRQSDEPARLAEERRKAEEAARLAEEKRRAEEAARLAEEQSKAKGVAQYQAAQESPAWRSARPRHHDRQRRLSAKLKRGHTRRLSSELSVKPQMNGPLVERRRSTRQTKLPGRPRNSAGSPRPPGKPTRSAGQAGRIPNLGKVAGATDSHLLHIPNLLAFITYASIITVACAMIYILIQ